MLKDIRIHVAHFFDVAQSISHQLKGAGAGFGFPLVSRLSADVNQGIKQREFQSLRDSISKLEHCCANIVKTWAA